MKNRIITVSREFGSGGRTIGKRSRKNREFPVTTTSSLKKSPPKAALTSGTSKNRRNTIRADFCRFCPTVRSD